MTLDTSSTRQPQEHSGTSAPFDTHAGATSSRPDSQETTVSPVSTKTPIVNRRQATAVDAPGGTYPGFRPRQELLKAGTVIDGGRPLRADIRADYDVAVTLRDGVVVYVDAFSPADRSADLPAIISWSPYGKHDHGDLLNMIPGRAGIPKSALSNLQKFEGPDPDDWCDFGYVVVNVDARGVYSSGGDHSFWSEQEGRDYYDVIEWSATQPWSNGKVGLSGNSWFAVSQWFAAAQRPPHLAAIAPWEGMSDYYRNMAVRGGIPTGDEFVDFILTNFVRGAGTVEDIPRNVIDDPLYNAYWETKRAAVEQIDVPAYVVASWTQLHSSGTLSAYRALTSDKWLRVHNTHEWPDYYDPTHIQDLRRFFDHYLRGADNDWPATPRVRLSVLDPGGTDVVDQIENEFPLARTTFQALHLDAHNATLDVDAPTAPSEARYDAAAGQAVFTHRFDADTDLIGYSNLHLWVEADGSDDMDLFVRIDKLGPDGDLRSPLVLGQPVQGTSGQLRVSHRSTDPDRSTPSEPYLTHQQELLLAAGEIVAVEIGLWATSLRFHAGESLQLTISGARIIPTELNMPSKVPLRNHGTHILHTGGQHDSHLLIPVTPAGTPS